MMRQFQIHIMKPKLDTPVRGRMWVGLQREHSFNEQMQVAVSHLLVCPCCCEIWADVWIEGDSERWPIAQSCETCAYKDEWIPVPGSLLNEEGWGVIDDSLLAALPPDLLRREFNLHMRHLGNE